MNSAEDKYSKRRIGFFTAIIFSLFAVLEGRLVYIQLVRHGEYADAAAAQHIRKVRVTPKRGTIYDRNGRELALSVRAYSVAANPFEISDPEGTARSLAPIVDVDYPSLLSKLLEDQSFVWVKRQISVGAARRIEEIGLKGVYLFEESKRFYPQRTLASNVVGLAGVDGQGLEGVEMSLDDHIRGSPGWLVVERDALGKEVWRRNDGENAPIPGRDVFLTIDHVVQYIAERELREKAKLYKFKSGIIIVVDPQTGEILAMANYPTFDPNRVDLYDPSERRNRAITDPFEPGSDFKVVTAAAALEEGVVSPETEIFCENGRYRAGNYTFKDFYPRGTLTFSEVMEISSNIGVIKTAEKLEKERLYEYARNFGFGTATGIELPGEASGVLKRPAEWSGTSLGSIAIGQEISVTALQLSMAYSAIANGGVLMKPLIVKEIRNPDGSVERRNTPKVVRRVISEKTSSVLTDILERVVEQGTGRAARLRGYNVAGKTGTAQMVDPSTGEYSDKLTNAIFVGYVPARNPRVVISIVLLDPRYKEGLGGSLAAPMFADIAPPILRRLGIPPQGSRNISEMAREKIEVPQVVGLAPSEAERRIERASLVADIIGVGDRVSYQDPPPQSSVPPDTVVRLYLGHLPGGTNTMPDVRGMTMRRVATALAPYGLEMRFQGSGIAVRQSPNPGDPIEAGDTAIVDFELR
ncbi:MAG: penicillin-binding transpeptidase domain-containing protein [bacterium]